MSDIIKRETIESVYQIKLALITYYRVLEETESSINHLSEQINGYSPFRIDRRFDNHGEKSHIKYIDRQCWTYIVNLFDLHKYMLCTDYEKMQKQIENFDFPEYTVENAQAWLTGLKDLIYDNIKTLIKTVFDRITSETYYTGPGANWNKQKKKRNNNGVDELFILTTYDHLDIKRYANRPTITNDLEKVCYLIDNKTLPDVTIKDMMRREQKFEAENEYFNIRICKNGNTHYKIKDKNILNKLNLFGSNNNTIGENIRIKVFEKAW